MRHNRDDVIARTIREFEALDRLVAELSDEEWALPVPRPESRDPWTVKDSLAHTVYWKANTARSIRKERKPPEERGFKNVNDLNRLIYERWRDRSPQEVLAWHRQVQEDLISALREAPEEYFSGREHNPQWPFDIDGHSVYHRERDIEQALAEHREKP